MAFTIGDPCHQLPASCSWHLWHGLLYNHVHLSWSQWVQLSVYTKSVKDSLGVIKIRSFERVMNGHFRNEFYCLRARTPTQGGLSSQHFFFAYSDFSCYGDSGSFLLFWVHLFLELTAEPEWLVRKPQGSSPAGKYKHTTTTPGIFHWIMRINLRSSRLQNNHVIDWALSLVRAWSL